MYRGGMWVVVVAVLLASGAAQGAVDLGELKSTTVEGPSLPTDTVGHYAAADNSSGTATPTDTDTATPTATPTQTPTPTPTPAPEPPDYRLSIESPPDDLNVDEDSGPIDATISVTNQGGRAGRQDVSIYLLDEAGVQMYHTAKTGVSLAAGESRSLTFRDVPVGSQEPGTFQLVAVSENHTVSNYIFVKNATADPNYELSNLHLSTDTVARGGGPIDVSVDVTNTGNADGNEHVNLIIHDDRGRRVHYQGLGTVEIASGESRSLTFRDVPVDDLEPGTYTVYVLADGNIEAPLTVTPDSGSPDYELSNVRPASPSIEEGTDEVTVSVDVTNAGDGTGDFELQLRVRDEDGDSYPTYWPNRNLWSGSIAPGETETKRFHLYRAENLNVGEYTIIVTSANDTAKGQLSVTKVPGPANFQLSDFEIQPETVTWGEDSFERAITFTNEGPGGGSLDGEIVFVNDEGTEVYARDSVSGRFYPGESRRSTLDMSPWNRVPPGEYTVVYRSGADSASHPLTVLKGDWTPTETEETSHTETEETPATSTDTTSTETEVPTESQTATATQRPTDAETATDDGTPVNPDEPPATDSVDIDIDLGDLGFTSPDGSSLQISISFGDGIDVDIDFGE